MGDGIYTALTGALAQQNSLDIIANNVANASTVGFRGDRAVFGELVRGAGKNSAQAPAGAGGKTNGPADRFVMVDSVLRDSSDGSIKQTGNKLDFALHGDGFFVVRAAQGDRLTRAGSFMARPDGALVTPEGSAVIGDNGKPIVLPPGAVDVQVARDGVIQADGRVVGKFLIGQVADSRSLEKLGAAYMAAPPSGQLKTAPNVEVTQGALEVSNVNAVSGLNELITVNRTFDALQKVIETFNKIDERCARDVGSRG